MHRNVHKFVSEETATTSTGPNPIWQLKTGPVCRCYQKFGTASSLSADSTQLASRRNVGKCMVNQPDRFGQSGIAIGIG